LTTETNPIKYEAIKRQLNILTGDFEHKLSYFSFVLENNLISRQIIVLSSDSSGLPMVTIFILLFF